MASGPADGATVDRIGGLPDPSAKQSSRHGTLVDRALIWNIDAFPPRSPARSPGPRKDVMPFPPPVSFLIERAIKAIGNPAFSEKVRRKAQQEAPPVLWHYTTGDKLIEMIKSKTIWATQLSCLNDSQELVFGARVVNGIAKKRLERCDSAPSQRFYEFISEWTNSILACRVIGSHRRSARMGTTLANGVLTGAAAARTATA